MLPSIERTSFWVAVVSGLVGFFLSLGKVIGWMATIRDEHEMLLKHLEGAKNHVLDIQALKLGQEQAKSERDMLLDEVRGLREDVNEFIAVMLKRG